MTPPAINAARAARLADLEALIDGRRRARWGGRPLPFTLDAGERAAFEQAKAAGFCCWPDRRRPNLRLAWSRWCAIARRPDARVLLARRWCRLTLDLTHSLWRIRSDSLEGVREILEAASPSRPRTIAWGWGCDYLFRSGLPAELAVAMAGRLLAFVAEPTNRVYLDAGDFIAED